MADLFYSLIVLSIPAMFGFVAGREFRRETLASKIGKTLISAANDRLQTRSFVGGECVILTTLTLRLKDKPAIKIVLEDA